VSIGQRPAYPAADTLAAAGVRISVTDDVLTVTLSRPDVHNAQTPVTWHALASVGAAITPDIRIVVIAGDGPSFSSGLDRAMFTAGASADDLSLAGLAAMTDGDLDEALRGFQAGFTWLRRPEFISVAAVQGHAVGAGFQLALACDLRVVTDDVHFSMRETTLGLVPDLGGTKPLVDLVGYSRALEICTTGRSIEAAEARHLGLATIVVPTARLSDALADLVAALSSPLHGAVAATKQVLLDAADRTFDEQCAAERAVQAVRLRELAAALNQP
jgi:enoyl-CoA hydratase/carnithine racemase